MSNTEKTKKVSYYKKHEDLTLDEWQVALRRQFALKQDFVVKNTTDERVFSDFLVYNPTTGKEYKVAIRSYEFSINKRDKGMRCRVIDRLFPEDKAEATFK